MSKQSIVIVGNLNVGKTVIFNRICGAKSNSANYPGTSVQISRGVCREGADQLELIDTPGIRSIFAMSEDEIVFREILLFEDHPVIAQVADGKNLKRTILLTLQLAEYGLPMTLDINMMDEARSRGISIDTRKLSGLLGIDVTTSVAIEGEGISSVKKAIASPKIPRKLAKYHPEISEGLSQISQLIPDNELQSRALALMLLTGDQQTRKYISEKYGPEILQKVNTIASSVQSQFPRPLNLVLMEGFTAQADRIVTAVQDISPPMEIPFSEKIGEWSGRLSTGIPIALFVLFLMYLFVGWLGAQTLVGLFEGKLFGEVIIPYCERLLASIPFPIVQEAFVGQFGLITVGLSLALGVVLPVITTFFFAFALLEDSGYLPRLSILLDRGFRKIGLNGKGVLPLVMGFSCITMAILTTRILDTRKERIIVTLLLVFGIPCAPLLAVMLVVLADLSFWAPVVLFGLFGTQIIIAGILANKFIKGTRSDFILELPPIRLPKFNAIVIKTLHRSRSFLIEAVPLFLLATFILFILDQLGMLILLEKILAPILVDFIGMPVETVNVFLITIIRKEAGAAMINQMADAQVFDGIQAVIALMMLTIITPCINALLMIIKEHGLKVMIIILCIVTPYAVIMGGILNWVLRSLGVSFTS